MLRGILPIVFTPFDRDGQVDAESLRRIVRFELEGGVHGIGINGFASEAYKLTDDERRNTVAIVAHEVAGAIPLIIGIAPGSTEAAIQQAREFAKYQPAALMTLPPATMDNGIQSLVEHYIALGKAVDIPIMVQQSPHIPAYSHCALPAHALAEIAHRAPNVRYFKIEGPSSAQRMAQLHPLVDEPVSLFGGGGGITVIDELRAGANGLIPGVGFNEIFMAIWQAWERGDTLAAETILQQAQPLIDAVSLQGHEYSLHARKRLMNRVGYISDAIVRQPTVPFSDDDHNALIELVDKLNLRISQPAIA